MNRLIRTAAITIAATSMLIACDDDGSGGTPAPVAHEGTQTQSIEAGKSASQLSAMPDGADQAQAQAPISQVGSQLQALAGQYQQFQAQGTGSAIGQLTQGQAAEGDVSWDGTTLSADVTYSSPQAAIHYVVALTISDNDLGGKTFEGSFDMDFSTSTPQYDVAYSYFASYDAVTLDGMGCPVSGTLALTYALTLGGDAFNDLPAAARAQINSGAAGSGTVLATFGPTCGEVSVAGN
jgi:hypothetical protein